MPVIAVASTTTMLAVLNQAIIEALLMGLSSRPDPMRPTPRKGSSASAVTDRRRTDDLPVTFRDRPRPWCARVKGRSGNVFTQVGKNVAREGGGTGNRCEQFRSRLNEPRARGRWTEWREPWIGAYGGWWWREAKPGTGGGAGATASDGWRPCPELASLT